MFRALVWKEWRQLWMLRWAGFGLGAVLPIGFLAGAVRRSGDATHVIFLELLPAVVGLALWPLFALLSATQSFCGDRAAGTESFLLERPVPRGRIWRARLLSSVGSTGAVAIVTLVLWAAISAAATGTGPGDWSGPAWMFAAGVVASAIVFLGGIAAASLVQAPFVAVLLGLLLSLILAWAAANLAALFPFAQLPGFAPVAILPKRVFGDLAVDPGLRHLPLGLVVPWSLLVAFAAASWVSMCRGEPAGRGRTRNAGLVLGAGVILAAIVFVVAAPIAVRANARVATYVTASPSGGSAWVCGEFAAGGWFVDLTTARRERFIAPPVDEVSFSLDGKRVAVFSRAGPLGSATKEVRLEVYDANGDTLKRSVPIQGFPYEPIRFADSHVVFGFWGEGRGMSLDLVSLDSGHKRVLDLDRSFLRWSLVGPADDGRLFLALGPKDMERAGSRSSDDNWEKAVEYGVYPLDVEAAKIGATPLLRDVGLPFRASRRLSPSGRYWLVDRESSRDATRPILDLKTGQTLDAAIPNGKAWWLAGDVLAWIDTVGDEMRLAVGHPGQQPSMFGTRPKAKVVGEVSPDRKRLLLEVGENPQKASVYDTGSGRLTELPPWASAADRRRWGWAGPRTLYRAAPGYLAFADVETPAVVRVVTGRAP